MKIFGREVRAALVDMDGVLYDSMKWHTLAWQRMMQDQGVECTRDEFYLYEGMTGAATIRLLFKRSGLPEPTDEEVKTLYAIKSKYFREMGEPELMPGTLEVLRKLKDGGVECVLVTGSSQQSVLDRLSRDYPGIFDEDKRITAFDVTKGKPDPEPYLRGLAKAGVKADEAIVLENAPLGVKAGVAAGVYTIAVATGPIPHEELEKAGAARVYNNFHELNRDLEG